MTLDVTLDVMLNGEHDRHGGGSSETWLSSTLPVRSHAPERPFGQIEKSYCSPGKGCR